MIRRTLAWVANLAHHPRHRHDWRLEHTTLTGWSVYRCSTCGETDIG